MVRLTGGMVSLIGAEVEVLLVGVRREGFRLVACDDTRLGA